MKKHKVLIIISIVLILMTGIAVYLYNYFNFTGTVTNKYIIETPGQWIVWKTHKIEIDTWFGQETVCVEKDLYEKIEIENKYKFTREFPLTNYVDSKIEKSLEGGIIGGKISENYFWYDNFIVEYYGTTAPTYYISLTDDNISDIFNMIGSKLEINNISDFEKYLVKRENIKVEMEEQKQKDFEKMYFQEDFENIQINYIVLKGKDDQIYINIYSNEYTDAERIYVKVAIRTNMDGININQNNY